MAQDTRYYPEDQAYFAAPDTIYAEWMGVDCPNPCRKYHISSAVQSAKRIADAILPYLVHANVHHKVVKTQCLLQKQMQGRQAGKSKNPQVEAICACVPGNAAG